MKSNYLATEPQGATIATLPTMPHQAHEAGRRAAIRDEDLASVVYDAIAEWPGTLEELSELVASASLGFWSEGGRS